MGDVLEVVDHRETEEVLLFTLHVQSGEYEEQWELLLWKEVGIGSVQIVKKEKR